MGTPPKITTTKLRKNTFIDPEIISAPLAGFCVCVFFGLIWGTIGDMGGVI
jgi:hypothetical protein